MGSTDLGTFWSGWSLLNICCCSPDPTGRTELYSELANLLMPHQGCWKEGRETEMPVSESPFFAQPSPFVIKALQPRTPGSHTFTMLPYSGICSLLIVTVTLSPATAAPQSEKYATREEVYPPLWELAPENLLDFPVKGNKIVINAWNYQERLGMYKNLLKSSAKYFIAFGSQNVGNILWGLPSQHGWQFRTGMSYVLKLGEVSVCQTHFGPSSPRLLPYKSSRASDGVNFDILSLADNLKNKSCMKGAPFPCWAIAIKLPNSERDC